MAEQNGYQEAMNDAANAAWDQDWDVAITAYQQAVQVAPKDPQAMAGLALSLMEARRYPEALATYAKVSELVPSDPLSHEKMAEIYQLTNKPKDAAQKYLAVAEIYFGRKDMINALNFWEEAVGLNVDLPQAHIRLAVIYEKNPELHPKAVASYVTLARLLQQHNQQHRAEQSLNRALKLDNTNPDARAAIDSLKQNRPIAPVNPAIFSKSIKPPPPPPPEPEDEDDEMLAQAGEAAPDRTVIEDAARYAMGLLSDLIMSGEVPSEALGSLLGAIESHQIGDAEGAIEMYEQVLTAGLQHPALLFNLGLLYQYSHRHTEAIDYLENTTTAPEYSAASNFSLGQIYMLEDEMLRAARHLVDALRGADLTASAEIGTHIDEAGYDRLKASLAAQTAEQLTDLCKGISAYLDDEKWLPKLRDTRSSYLSQNKTTYVSDLVELVTEGGNPVMAAIMDQVDLYISRGMFRLAMNETHYAIEKSPDYLPAHRRIADILLKQGHSQDAADKINLVANAYHIRGNAERAADLFSEVLTIWPADMGARQRVLDMLKEQGRSSEALHHYAEMGDLYYRLMADQGKAIETYNEGLAYARSNGVSSPKVVAILKAMADMENNQLNWSQALDYYHQAQEIAPDDEKVAVGIIDLNFQLGDGAKAIAALDGYIQYCLVNGHSDRVTATLEKQARNRPNEVAIRHRLAEVYKQLGRESEAIAQFDAIGEMLLDAGRIDEAKATIQKIVDMNPSDVDDYRELLSKL